MLIKNQDLCLGCFALKSGQPVCPVCGWHDGLALVADDGPAPGTVLDDHYAVGRILEMDEHSTSYLAMDVNSGVKVVLTRYAPGANGDARYETAPYAERSAGQEPPTPHPEEGGAPNPERSASPAHTERSPRAAIRLPAWASGRGRLAALVCAAVLVLAGSTALAAFLIGQPADEVRFPPDEPVLHAAQTAVPDTAAPDTAVPDTAVPDTAAPETPAAATSEPTSEPTPAPTPPPASQATETPVPEWSDWQTAHARYANDPAYITESRKEYRFARVIYDESDWSAWSASPPPAGSAETETGYRTCNFAMIYSDSTYVDGYTFTGVITSRPGEWGEWGTQEITPSDTIEVETRAHVGTSVVTTYRYSRYLYSNPDGSLEASASNPGGGYHQTTGWLDGPLVPKGSGAYGTLIMDDVGIWFNEETGQKESVDDTAVTQYRSREIREMYEHAAWGDWSDWKSGTPPASTSYVQVETRYRYKTRTEKTGAWSDWQQESVTAKKDVKVETRTLYRYMPGPEE